MSQHAPHSLPVAEPAPQQHQAVSPSRPAVDREGVRYPKFREDFARLDFSAEREIPVISLFEMPAPLELEASSLVIEGLDGETQTLRFDELDTLPRQDTVQPLICQIFNWAERVSWQGFRLASVLDQAGLAGQENAFYSFHSRDGQFFETLSHAEAMDERCLIAHGLNGEPLSHEHGGPLRLAVPFLQGYKSVKWLSGISASREDPQGIKRILKQSKTAVLAEHLKRAFDID